MAWICFTAPCWYWNIIHVACWWKVRYVDSRWVDEHSGRKVVIWNSKNLKFYCEVLFFNVCVGHFFVGNAVVYGSFRLSTCLVGNFIKFCAQNLFRWQVSRRYLFAAIFLLPLFQHRWHVRSQGVFEGMSGEVKQIAASHDLRPPKGSWVSGTSPSFRKIAFGEIL